MQFVFSALLLLLAAKQWRGRPAPGADPVRENAVIVAVLLIVIGVLMLGKGIGSL